MKLVLKKLDVTDLATLEKIAVENIEAVEPGLHVLDSRLLLGHSTIDLVAQDARGSLVLIALGRTADETMLLRIVDACSWCMEYADSVRRYLPTLTVSEERPPRIIFLTEHVPDSFQRKVKQLNFPAIDLIEFRLIDVNGVPAPYFETVARIRRSTAAASALVPDLGAGRSTDSPHGVRLSEAAVPANGAASGASRPRTIEIPKAPVAAAATMISAEHSLKIEPAVTPPSAEPAIDAMLREVLSETPATPKPESPVARPESTPPSVEPAAPELEAAASTAVCAVAEPQPVPTVAEVEEPPTAALPDEPTSEPAREAATAESTSGAPATATRAAEAPDANQKYLFSEAARATQIAKDFGIELPKDGALTRQWVDFLNQLAAK